MLLGPLCLNVFFGPDLIEFPSVDLPIEVRVQ